MEVKLVSSFRGLSEREVGGLRLVAPVEFWDDNPIRVLLETGGCGPGKFGDLVIPDRLLFVDIRPACVIHDWMYGEMQTAEDKLVADAVLYSNMISIVRTRSRWWLSRVIREWMARWYFRAVVDVTYRGLNVKEVFGRMPIVCM